VPFANGAALFVNCGELSNVKLRRFNVLTADRPPSGSAARSRGTAPSSCS
jgi:hypothetical protein